MALSSGMWNYHVLPAEDSSPEWLLMLVNGHPAEQLVDEQGKESLLVMETKEVKHHEQTVHKRWVPPLTGTLKINVDVAFKPEIEGVVLWLLYEIMKAILNSAWWILFRCRHAEEAETAACLEGIRLAAGWPHFFSGISFSFFFASKRESIFHLSLSISK